MPEKYVTSTWAPASAAAANRSACADGQQHDRGHHDHPVAGQIGVQRDHVTPGAGPADRPVGAHRDQERVHVLAGVRILLARPRRIPVHQHRGRGFDRGAGDLTEPADQPTKSAHVAPPPRIRPRHAAASPSGTSRPRSPTAGTGRSKSRRRHEPGGPTSFAPSPPAASPDSPAANSPRSSNVPSATTAARRPIRG